MTDGEREMRMRSSSRVSDMGMRLPLLWMEAGCSAMRMRGWSMMVWRNSMAWGPRSPRIGGVGLPVL